MPICMLILSLAPLSACSGGEQQQSFDNGFTSENDGDYVDEDDNGSPDGDSAAEDGDTSKGDHYDLIMGETDQSDLHRSGSPEGEIDRINPCRLAENHLGYIACRTNLANEGEYYQLSQSEEIDSDIDRVSKYLLPANTNAPLPGMVQNVNRFSLHYEFLKTAFPALYGALTVDQYEDLVLNNATRQYFAGALLKLTDNCKGAAYAFTVYNNSSESLLDKLQISYIQKSLAKMMPGEEILYFPMSAAEEDQVESWTKDYVKINVYDCGAPLDYEPYNTGTAYGYVRILTMSEFEEASAEGLLGWQDIIVLEGTPFNIMSPAAAIVTGERQNVLSHINVQASVRGTPNMYVRNPFEVFAPYEGMLARLAVGSGDYEVKADVSADEAQAWWNEIRPHLENVVIPDYSYSYMPELDEVAVADKAQRKTAFSRFGGKGANLAILSSVIDHNFMVDGFLIPFHYFQDFMYSNSLTLSDDPDSAVVSYANYVKYWVNDEEFRLSAVKRRAILGRLTNNMLEASNIDNNLVRDIAERIEAVFGSENVMVRLRSSSNMEDSVEFSGAGLYESYSACAADSFGGNPAFSQCDSSKNRQMTIQSALRKVWASFWKSQAFEERFYFQYYQPDDTAMAIAVTPAFGDEAANGVVFTGLPNNPGDKRMLVNSQMGETSVVSPPQGILPETAILAHDGERTAVTRIQASSLVNYPATVLSDSEYSQMAEVLDQVRRDYPMDVEGYPADSIILDLEFKFTQDRRLFFKQSRHFLIKTESSTGDADGFDLEVAADATMCGQFVDFREPLDEYALKTRVNLKSQQVMLPVEGDIDVELIDSIEFGPDRISLDAATAPQWERRSTLQDGKTSYQFTYCNTFAGSGIEAEICWRTSGYELAGSFSPALITIDEDQISALRNDWSMTLYSDGQENEIRLSSCSYENYPTYRRTAILPDGSRITMDVRQYPTIIGSYNSALVSVKYEDGDFVYSNEDYFRLVYSAEHHNLREKLMFVFDRPVSGIGGFIFEEPYVYDSEPVKVIELDADLQEVDSYNIQDYETETVL